MELSGQIWRLLIFLNFMRPVDGVSNITESRRQAVNVSLTLTCKDDRPITGDVIFLQGALPTGGCSPDCGTGISGYAVSQNTTARETYLTISSLEEPRDCGSWSCGQGTVADSPPLMIQCPLPCLINPSTDITVTPPVSSLTSADNISVQVSVPCCSRNAVIKWTYQKQNESPVLLASSTTTPGGSCPAGEKQTLNTFQPHQTAFLTPGEVNLTLTIEHDSFDPPDYTVVFTTLIDVRVDPRVRTVPHWEVIIDPAVTGGLPWFPTWNLPKDLQDYEGNPMKGETCFIIVSFIVKLWECACSTLVTGDWSHSDHMALLIMIIQLQLQHQEDPQHPHLVEYVKLLTVISSSSSSSSSPSSLY